MSSNKKKATDIVGAINKWSSFGERLWKFAKVAGIDSWLAFVFWTVSAAALATTARIVNATPWYILLTVAVLFASGLVHLWNGLRVAWLIRGVKSFDLEQFAEECCSYYRDYSAFMVANQRVHISGANAREDLRKQFEESVAASQRLAALLIERFAPRTFALAHQMKSLGIKEPNLFNFSSGDTGGAGVYIGVVGELLKHGLLEEARKLDPQMTWGASIR